MYNRYINIDIYKKGEICEKPERNKKNRYIEDILKKNIED